MNKIETHVVVDMLYDFINGSLACLNGEEAVRESVRYINAHPEQKVLYICDHHPADHCSFKEYGGIWPAHCVAGTRGGSIHEDYYTEVSDPANRPCEANVFYKGRNREMEEYSGFEAVNANGLSLSEVCTPEVVVSGIATEYCIKETVIHLHKHHFKVTVFKDALAYVDPRGHLDTLAELSPMIAIR